MRVSIKIITSHERDVVYNILSDHVFFFKNLTPFKFIFPSEEENVFYVYGEIPSIFSVFPAEAKVRKFVSPVKISYVMLFQPRIIKLPREKEIDMMYMGSEPTGSGKIEINENLDVQIEYEGEKEKPIVSSIKKSIEKSLKEFDEMIRKERITRHI
ncbi:DUF3211 domain-containing protein [Sulfurisphaera javensis]|uniref:DUF3211 domain-containing protein n=1 Tax=Sulfurisphaera javensis TaxID=2049879 RepID=A0AAT9GQK5_9CREN